MDSPLLTIPEVAKQLNVPESYAYELARQGKLPTVKIGKYVRVTYEGLKKYQMRLDAQSKC
jgi:excisionase family DNA binding protein